MESMSKMEEEMKRAEQEIKARKEETEKSKVLGASIRFVFVSHLSVNQIQSVT